MISSNPTEKKKSFRQNFFSIERVITAHGTNMKKHPCTCPDVMTTQTLSSMALSVAILLIFVYVIFRSMIRVKEWYDSQDPMLKVLQERLQKVDPMADRVRFFRGSKRYTINKQKVYLCLYDERNEYYPMNMLMYVALHELAHCLCKEIGHTESFFEIFRKLLKKAEEVGVYDPDIPPIDNYCMSPDEDEDE